MIRETSVEAYHKIEEEGLLSTNRFQVYEVLYRHGPLTAGEIFDFFQNEKIGHTVVKGSVCARLTELRHLGVAQEVGSREWDATGHRGLLWDVTKNIPMKQPKRKTKDQIIEELREQIANLELQLELDNYHGDQDAAENA